MSKIDPKMMKNIFTKDVLDSLPSNRDINRGVANRLKADDPNIANKLTKASTETWQDPEHRKKMEKVHADRSQTEWLTNVTKANQWENKSEDAKRNILASREKLKTDDNFQRTVKERTATESWQKANKLASQKKWKNPKNIRTCPHCAKSMAANSYERHMNSCVFAKGKVITYKGEVAQFEYATEEALISDGFEMMRVKQIINTDKIHCGVSFRNE